MDMGKDIRILGSSCFLLKSMAVNRAQVVCVPSDYVGSLPIIHCGKLKLDGFGLYCHESIILE